MESVLTKSREGNNNISSPVIKKDRKLKVKKSVLQLSKELIPDGKYAGLSTILEPYELGLGK